MKLKRILLPHWMLASLAGFGASLIWVEVGERPDLGVTEGMVGGLIVSFVQGLILRRYITPLWPWMLANTLTWGLLGYTHWGVLGWVAPRSLNLGLRLFYGGRDGFLMGLWLGLGYWYSFRKQAFQPWRWFYFSPLIWGIGLPLGWIFGGILRQLTHLFFAEVIGLSLTWGFVGSCLGMLWHTSFVHASSVSSRSSSSIESGAGLSK